MHSNVFLNEILPISSAFVFLIINIKIMEKIIWEKTIIHMNCFEHAKGLLKHHELAASFEH
jgi:hypothetical protein